MSKLMDAITKLSAKERRKMLANQIFDRYDGVVQRGPYKGLKLNGKANVSRGPLGLKILGLYEHCVVDRIAEEGSFDDLINFGAADGYMALGPLFAGQCQRSICFELTQTGRDAVQINAELNGVAEKVVLRGKVDQDIKPQLAELSFNPQKSLVLCDIEGAEFEVLTDEVLQFLKGATLIIELHDRLLDKGTSLREELIARLPEGASHNLLRLSSSADFDGITDLENMHDNDRALVMSEGRKMPGEWLVVEYE